MSNDNDNNSLNTPSIKTMINAVKIALNEDKAIMLDYYLESIKGTCVIGKNMETQEKILAKSDEEYTSPISKIFKVENEYIIQTENSIYIVSCKIPTKKIS